MRNVNSRTNFKFYRNFVFVSKEFSIEFVDFCRIWSKKSFHWISPDEFRGNKRIKWWYSSGLRANWRIRSRKIFDWWRESFPFRDKSSWSNSFSIRRKSQRIKYSIWPNKDFFVVSSLDDLNEHSKFFSTKNQIEISFVFVFFTAMYRFRFVVLTIEEHFDTESNSLTNSFEHWIDEEINRIFLLRDQNQMNEKHFENLLDESKNSTRSNRIVDRDEKRKRTNPWWFSSKFSNEFSKSENPWGNRCKIHCWSWSFVKTLLRSSSKDNVR